MSQDLGAPVAPVRPGATIPEGPAPLPPVQASPPVGQGAPRRRKRWPFVAGGVLLLLVVVTAVAWGPLSRAITIRQARSHGVILDDEIGAVELGWGEVTVRDFAFKLEGVAGVKGKGKELVVELDWLTPSSLRANEVELSLVGSAAVLAVDISEWTGAHPELVTIPTKADGVSLSWQESADGPVWLKFREGTIEPLKNGARLGAERTSVFGLPIGGVGAVWKGDEAKVKLGFGTSDEGDAPITIEVEELRTQPKATIAMRPTPLAKLSGPLGVLLPIPDVDVSGSATLQYQGKRKAPIVGSVEATLDGYRPPLPREAQGFVFGDETKLATDVEVSADRTKISLANTKVTHGGFSLTGQGSIVRNKTHAAIDLELTGRISCAALAKAALAGGVGPRLGPMVEQLAAGAVKGSVDVKLVVSANTKNLLGAKIERKLGIGCGVKWPDLPPLPEGFPKIPNIPGLPSFTP